MFCPKCGSKVEEGALFCGSCGEKMIKSEAAEQVQDAQPLQENVKRPIVEPSSDLYKKAPNIKDPVMTGGAKSISPNTIEVCKLLETNMGKCSEIKSVKQIMNGVSLSSRFKNYIVGIGNNQARISSVLTFPFSLLYGLPVGFVAAIGSNIGWDFMEGSVYMEDYALLFVLCLLTGGLAVAIPPFIGSKEKVAVTEYVRGIMEPQGITLTSNEMKPVIRLVISVAMVLIGILIFIFGVLN